MRLEITSLKKAGAFFSRLKLVLAFSLFQMLEEKIVQEYKKFRKRYPGYREEKRRCEYLHQKLSHIKGLILEFEEKNRGS